ncbi:hypothetical protein ACFXKG_23680 [Streptomyces sp. NPDC059255]|uniref:hypothetical protein n=1 Tax=Streptomyces sp. NPDC059255 TaxID=3346793 RepID=UPI0036B38093
MFVVQPGFAAPTHQRDAIATVHDRTPHRWRFAAALSEPAGPEHGTASLPLDPAWPGLTAFDLDRPGHGRAATASSWPEAGTTR